MKQIVVVSTEGNETRIEELMDAGSCLLIVPQNLLIEATQNFIGEPKEELEQEHLSGTLTEMLNMICGNALSKIETKTPFIDN